MSDAREKWMRIGWVLGVLLVALVLRGSGIYRGIPHGVSYHPDAAKQVLALGNYLEGKYVWYTGLRFYDSYPLFLNHFDEWIIRPIRAAAHGVAGYVGLGDERAPPSSENLYYWTMTLRWLYGVVVVGLTGLIAGRLRFGFWPAWVAMALVALSPVNITVSHFGTGDIACDLFFALTVLCVAQHVRTDQWRWLAAAGLMAGWTFAGKYNGGLAALFIASYASLLCLAGSRRVARFVGMGLLSGAAFIAGVVIAMPQFVWATKRTWRDMLRVIEHARDYRAPDEFLELPHVERAWVALSHNIGAVLWALGVLGLIAALYGLVLAFRSWRRQYAKSPEREEYRRDAALVALFIFPWLVLSVSLKSKLNLHHFYFSWIYPAIALSAMYALSGLLTRERTSKSGAAGQWAFAGLAFLLLVELGVRTPSETYFWKREDIRTLARLQIQHEVLPETRPRRAREVVVHEAIVRDYLLEPYNVSNFRNRPLSLLAPDAAVWREMGTAPLPFIPFGAPVTDWIVLNGPVLPRNDRMFKVPEAQPFDVILVTHEPLEQLRLGIQSGIYPTTFNGRVGGQRVEGHLDAQDWTVLPLDQLRARKVMKDGGRSERRIYHYRFRLRSELGPVWFTLLPTDEEEQVFRLFAGDPALDGRAFGESIDWNVLDELTERMHYRRGEAFASEPISAWQDQSMPLWPSDEVLPAGPYRLTLQTVGLTTNTVIRLQLHDEQGRSVSLGTEKTFALLPGENVVDYRFEKSFVPFQCTVRVDLLSGDAIIGEWNLKPDVRALAVQATGDEPLTWLRRFPDESPPDNWRRIDTSFGGRIKVHEAAWPDPLIPGQTQAFHVRVSLPGTIRHFDEHDVFLHIYGEAGEMLMAAHIRADQFNYAEEDSFGILLEVPEDIAPQSGVVRLGVWNRRTEVRLPVADYPAHIEPLRRNLIKVGTVEVESAP